MLHTCRVQQRRAVIQLSLLSFIHHCSICLSSSTSLGNLLKCLPSPHVLSLLRVRGNLHATETLVFPGFLSLTNMVVVFFRSEKTDTTLDLEEKVGMFPMSFGMSILWTGSKLLHIQQLAILPIPCGRWHDCSSAQLWQSSVPVDSTARYPLDPPNSPHGRHHFPPAYSVRNGGKKVNQPAQGHAESWGMCSGEDCTGPGRNLSLFGQLRPCWFQTAKPPLYNIFFA